MQKVIGEYEAQGMKFHEVTVAWWDQHPEMETRLAEAIKILTRR
jgi:hypothetical protein